MIFEDGEQITRSDGKRYTVKIVPNDPPFETDFRESARMMATVYLPPVKPELPKPHQLPPAHAIGRDGQVKRGYNHRFYTNLKHPARVIRCNQFVDRKKVSLVSRAAGKVSGLAKKLIGIDQSKTGVMVKKYVTAKVPLIRTPQSYLKPGSTFMHQNTMNMMMELRLAYALRKKLRAIDATTNYEDRTNAISEVGHFLREIGEIEAGDKYLEVASYRKIAKDKVADPLKRQFKFRNYEVGKPIPVPEESCLRLESV